MPLQFAPYHQSMRLGQGFNSFTQTICIDDAVILDPRTAQDVLRRNGMTIKDMAVAMRPVDSDRSPIKIGEPMTSGSRRGSEASRTTTASPLSPRGRRGLELPGSQRQQEKRRAKSPGLRFDSGNPWSPPAVPIKSRDISPISPCASPPPSGPNLSSSASSVSSSSSLSSHCSSCGSPSMSPATSTSATLKRNRWGMVRRSSNTVASKSSPKAVTSTAGTGSRKTSPSSSISSASGHGRKDSIPQLRVRVGEPEQKFDWGSQHDSSVPEQKVEFVAKFVDSLSEITSDMNLSGAKFITRGRLDHLASDSFIDSEQFYAADLNFYVRVRVTNQSVNCKDALQFNPEWIVVENEFTDTFGDSFISGFIDGGELNAIMSIKVPNKSKIKEIRDNIEIAFNYGRSLFTLDSLGVIEWDRRDIDNNTEIFVSAAWSGSGRIKSSQKQLPVHTLMETAAGFPELIAGYSYRTHAILTPYTYLKSFHLGKELLIPVAPYAQAAQRTNILLDAYLEYRNIKRQIEEDVEGIQIGERVFQPKDYYRSLTIPLRRDLSSIEDDGRFMHTLEELAQACRVANYQLKHIENEMAVISKHPEAAMETRHSITFQDPHVFRSRLPKILRKATRAVTARSAVVVQSEATEFYLVSSGGRKASLMDAAARYVPPKPEESDHFLGTFTFVKDGPASSGHIVKKIACETKDRIPPRIFTGVRHLRASPEAFTDPSMRFRTYNTGEAASSFDCCFQSWSERKISSGTLDILAINRTDPNFLTGAVDGRGVREWNIKFSRAFRKAPEVVVWMTGVDVNRSPEPFIDLEVRAVTPTGFRFLPKIADPNIWVSFSWLAYLPDAGNIASGFLEFNSRKHEFSENGKVNFPHGRFTSKPQVLVGLHSFALNPKIEVAGSSSPKGSKDGKKSPTSDSMRSEIETEIGKTNAEGFHWAFHSSVPLGCKVVMQWIALV